MTRKLVAECPAKINLYLRVGEPDKRGYHPLETEFQAIGLFDTLELTVGGSGLEVVGMELPDANTVSKTLRLMGEVASLPPVGLRLIKRIPSQAGLGGGSSDAAGLLRILRKLLPPVVPDRDFLVVAKSVGADVPFFLVGGRALGSGYGDVVEPLPDLEPKWLVIAKPDVGCSTPEMYARLDEFRAAEESAAVRSGHNDFGIVAPQECVDLIRRMYEMRLGPIELCGSGSAVFGFANSETEAVRYASALGGIAVRTLKREQSLGVSESLDA